MSREITVMEKYSANFLNVLEETTINTVYQAKYPFQGLVRDAGLMKAVGLEDDEAFRLIGLLYRHNVLTARQTILDPRAVAQSRPL